MVKKVFRPPIQNGRIERKSTNPKRQECCVGIHRVKVLPTSHKDLGDIMDPILDLGPVLKSSERSLLKYLLD